jgi:hypothetical protein
MNNLSKNIKNNDLWINKYKPHTEEEIIGNKQQINNFKNWLLNLGIPAESDSYNSNKSN